MKEMLNCELFFIPFIFSLHLPLYLFCFCSYLIYSKSYNNIFFFNLIINKNSLTTDYFSWKITTILKFCFQPFTKAEVIVDVCGVCTAHITPPTFCLKIESLTQSRRYSQFYRRNLLVILGVLRISTSITTFATYTILGRILES